MTTKFTLLTTAVLAGVGLIAADAQSHPLDPLSGDEITRTVELLKEAGHVDEAARYPIISLKEPAKAAVHAWEPGEDVPREASAVVRLGAEVYEADVNLDSDEVTRWEHQPDVQSPVLLEEWIAAQEITLADDRMVAALKERGITDLDNLFCAPFSMGNFGIAADEGKRLLKVGCFDTSQTENNIFMAPIEGLYAVVDLIAKEVHNFYDSGAVPVSQANFNFTEASQANLRDPLNPVRQHQPEGRNFQIDGHEVSWQNWSFHVRMDRRVGTVMSLVEYQDGDSARPILYQGTMGEMFVPYMDPDFGWYSRTYFDVGEYGAGLLASQLQPGVDCPHTAEFMSVGFNDDAGNPYEMPNGMCIFERAPGEPIWRHAEFMNETYEGRPAVELVVRMASQIGNYDYLVDWVFKLSGEIAVMVGASGIDAVKGVAAESMASPTAAEDTAYGTLVAPHLVAVFHDHYFSFRLDFDVDGEDNSFVQYRLQPQELPADSPRRGIYVYEEFIPSTETEARLDRHPGPTLFAVRNPNVSNAVGNPVGYEILPLSHYGVVLDDSEPSMRRAQFVDHDFWVTAHDPEELYPSGEYVFGSTGEEGDGLKHWTAQDRAIENTDIVVWHTVGMHHLTRAEDWPVMNTTWKGMLLRPLNFFDQNPALDLRQEFSAKLSEATQAE